MIYKIEWSKWSDDLKEMSQEDDKVLSITPQSHPGGMAMTTPLGMLPMPMTNAKFVSDNIGLYLMQTNFDLTNNIIKIAGLVRGVVSIEPITRYMARVGIPTSDLFDDDEVKENVEIAIKYFFESKHRAKLNGLRQDVVERVMEFRGKLSERQEFWTMLVLPNGSMEVASTNIYNEQYKNKCAFLVEIHGQIGGTILTSHDSESVNV
jgi:hypothetical protein